MSESTDKSKGRLNGSDRKQLVADYKTGDFTVKQLASTYNMSESGVRSIIQRAGAKKGEDSQRLANAEMEAKEEALKEAASRRVVMAVSVHDQSINILTALTAVAKKITAESVKDTASLARNKEQINSFSKLSAAVRSNLETTRIVSGLDKTEQEDDELPIIEIVEMSDGDVKEIRDQQEAVHEMMTGKSRGTEESD